MDFWEKDVERVNFMRCVQKCEKNPFAGERDKKVGKIVDNVDNLVYNCIFLPNGHLPEWTTFNNFVVDDGG